MSSCGGYMLECGESIPVSPCANSALARQVSKQWEEVPLFAKTHRSLGLALGSNSLHGLPHSFLITEEPHGLGGLQILVQLVHDGDPRG